MYACMRVCLYTIPCHIKPPTTPKGTLTRVHSASSKRPKRMRSLSYLEATCEGAFNELPRSDPKGYVH